MLLLFLGQVICPEKLTGKKQGSLALLIDFVVDAVVYIN